ncbi:MAG: hypothetical protein QXS90_02225 [Candidatus Diapherotrites archaeon]
MQNLGNLLYTYTEGLTNSYSNYIMLKRSTKNPTEEEKAEITKRANEIYYWLTQTYVKFQAIKNNLSVKKNDVEAIEQAYKTIETSDDPNEKLKSLETYIITLTKVIAENTQYEQLTDANREINKAGLI